MSTEIEERFELERQIRQEINNQRVRNNTETFLNKYTQIYNEIISERLEEYIPDEMSRLSQDLSTIRNRLVDDPFRARDISMAVQRYIYSLKSLARSTKAKFESEERLRRKQLEEEERKQRELEAQKKREELAALNKKYFDFIRSIKNPAIQNFAKDKIKEIRIKIDSAVYKSENELEDDLESCFFEAQRKVSEWKNKTIQENKKEVLIEQIKAVKDTIEAEKIEDSEKKSTLLEKINTVNINNSIESIQDELDSVQKEAEEVLINEEVRREAVKSIIKQLKSQGFNIDPNIQLLRNPQDDKENFVRICASMPNGKRAVCNLTNKGKIHYVFDHYEGKTCLKDIQKFHIDLESIYSIKLSDERIIWENPDEIGKDADRLPTSGQSFGRK